MNSLYVDTETTALTPGQIWQLSMIKLENGIIAGAANEYFAVPRLSSEIAEKCKITAEEINRIANGNTIDRLVNVLVNILSERDTELVGHSVDFDLKFLQVEIMKRTGKLIEPAYIRCTMKGYTDVVGLRSKNNRPKWPKLEELMNFCNITEQQVIDTSMRIFGNGAIAHAHSSAYDVTACMMCDLTLKDGRRWY